MPTVPAGNTCDTDKKIGARTNIALDTRGVDFSFLQCLRLIGAGLAIQVK